MLTTTSTYALIAMSTMVRNINRLPMTAKELAELGQIPTNYLSKIMRQLVRAGLVDGTRGIGGGFRFSRPPSRISLMDVVSHFEQVDRPRVCPFGNHTCTDEDPCAVHDLWGGVRIEFIRVLEDTDLASAASLDHPKRARAKRGAGRATPRAKTKACKTKRAASRAKRRAR